MAATSDSPFTRALRKAPFLDFPDAWWRQDQRWTMHQDMMIPGWTIQGPTFTLNITYRELLELGHRNIDAYSLTPAGVEALAREIMRRRNFTTRPEQPPPPRELTAVEKLEAALLADLAQEEAP